MYHSVSLSRSDCTFTLLTLVAFKSIKSVQSSSLSHVALGGGMEGGHLHLAGKLWAQLEQNLLKGVELAAVCVDVILVDLRQRNSLVKKHWTREMQNVGEKGSGVMCAESLQLLRVLSLCPRKRPSFTVFTSSAMRKRRSSLAKRITSSMHCLLWT